MHKNVNKIMCGMLAAAAALGMMTGCSKTDSTTSAAAGTATETTATTEVSAEITEDAEAGDTEIPVVEQLNQSAFRNRGVYATTSADGKYITLFICSGEKNTGGYGISVIGFVKDGGKLTITVEETSPDPGDTVIQALTYPCCKARIESDVTEISVRNTKDEEFTYQDNRDFRPDDGYVAVLRGGSGERTYETYVYRTDSGYMYVNVTSTTVSWGAAQWTSSLDSSDTVATKEEVLEIARGHSSGEFVTFPGDGSGHPVDDFLSSDL